VSEQLTTLLAELRSRGVRITTPRREILSALLRAGDHATVEDVAALVQERAPEVHLSTVYRTLDSLTELGVVEHVHFAHGAAAYHLAPTDHRHLVCEACGAVIDVPAELLDELARTVDERYGFELRAHHFGLSGRCARCRETLSRGGPPHDRSGS
jgi:Fe2+ or Zn2+ uptake regulation protein